MRVLINGEPIPNVCKGLAQYAPDADMNVFQSKVDQCAIILQHCKASDSPVECTTRMFSEATLHSMRDSPSEFYRNGVKIIDGTQAAALKFQAGIDLWFHTAAVTKLEDNMVANTLTFVGYLDKKNTP